MVRGIVGMLMAVMLAGCGGGAGSGGDALPPLTGVYRSADGALVEFVGDHELRGPAGRGTFKVEGTRVTIQLTPEKQVEATRTSADTLDFLRPGKPPITFYRAESAASRTPQAAAPQADQAKPAPDPSFPLTAYTPIRDAATVELLSVAFQAAPPSDDALLRMMGDQASANAFARRDLLAKERPALEARLEAARQQRYYRLEVVSASMLREPGQQDETRAFWSVGDTHLALKPYDLEHNGFPLVRCLSRTSVRFDALSASVQFVPDAGHPDACLLPMKDEQAARKLEGQRTGYLNAFVEADLYLFVTEGTRGSLKAVLTHADVTVFDPADPTHRTPLAKVAIPF
jgi:hypothetical protein